MKSQTIASILGCLAVAIVSMPVHAQQEPVVKGQGRIVITTSEQGDKEGAKTFSRTFVFPGGKGVWSFDVDGFPGRVANIPSRWIGVVCFPLNDAMRAQLDLPKGEGLLVAHVMPKSPADKAGIRSHDILLRAGDKKLTDVKDLFDAVGKAKDKKSVTVELLRKGKKQTVKVQPTKRPEEGGDALPKVMARIIGDAMNPQPFPAIKSFPDIKPFPKDLEVTISKKGSKPATIAVKQGDQKWEVTEESLGKLPKDVRGHVANWLATGPWWLGTFHPAYLLQPPMVNPRGGLGGQMLLRELEKLPHQPKAIRVLPPQRPGHGKSTSDRLENIETRLEELQKAIKGLEKKK